MIKRIIYLLLLIVSPLLALANDDAVALFKKGNALYQQAKYKEAAAAYQQMVDDGYQSTALYFNLGNAYYKTGDIAPSVLYYEKARKLSPGDEDVRVNLQLANTKTFDKIEESPEFFISKWWHGFILAMPANSLAVWAVVLFLLASGLFILYRFAGLVLVKKISFFTAITLLLIGIGTIFIADRETNYAAAHQGAIIFNSSVTVKSAPTKAGKIVFVLHEGTKVNILEKNAAWVKIRLANGNEGWIGNGDAKEI